MTDLQACPVLLVGIHHCHEAQAAASQAAQQLLTEATSVRVDMM